MALAETFESTERPVLRPAADGEPVCPDCNGALVVVDDGFVPGTVGSLIDCACVELAVPPGYVECGDCAALVRVTAALGAHHDELVREYLAFCAVAGMEPAWCPRCGGYRKLVNGVRATCGCVTVGRWPRLA
jgi:hypothetical protein